jgi:hypothetical protein
MLAITSTKQRIAKEISVSVCIFTSTMIRAKNIFFATACFRNSNRLLSITGKGDRMKSYEKIKLQLKEENPEALLADGFDKALIGLGRRCGQPTLAVYDKTKCINILCEDMSFEEAEEYFDFNVSGAWMGENTPIFIELWKGDCNVA